MKLNPGSGYKELNGGDVTFLDAALAEITDYSDDGTEGNIVIWILPYRYSIPSYETFRIKSVFCSKALSDVHEDTRGEVGGYPPRGSPSSLTSRVFYDLYLVLLSSRTVNSDLGERNVVFLETNGIYSSIHPIYEYHVFGSPQRKDSRAGLLFSRVITEIYSRRKHKDTRPRGSPHSPYETGLRQNADTVRGVGLWDVFAAYAYLVMYIHTLTEYTRVSISFVCVQPNLRGVRDSF